MAHPIPCHTLRRTHQDVVAHMDVCGVNEQKRVIVEANALAGKVVGLGAPLSEGARRRRCHPLSIPD